MFGLTVLYIEAITLACVQHLMADLCNEEIRNSLKLEHKIQKFEKYNNKIECADDRLIELKCVRFKMQMIRL